MEGETLRPETGEAISANPLQMGLIATCQDRTTVGLPAAGVGEEEKEEGDQAREGSEAENELAGTEETVKDISWSTGDLERLKKNSMRRWTAIGAMLGPLKALLPRLELHLHLPPQPRR